DTSADVSAAPTPSPRAASIALQIGGKMEPPDVSCNANPNNNNGTRSKFSVRWSADAFMRRNRRFSTESGSAAAAATRSAECGVHTVAIHLGLVGARDALVPGAPTMA